jgi:endonuclease YncB( thermonuclease family)
MPKYVSYKTVTSSIKKAVTKPSAFSIIVAIVTIFLYYQKITHSTFFIHSPRAVDGDTLIMDEQRIRLKSIDAPEIKQTCQIAKKSWKCGEAAKQKLESLIQNQELTCYNKGKDKYGRTLAICFIGNLDINAEMIKTGYAIAYDKVYLEEEKYAKQHKLGIWKCSSPPFASSVE